MNSIVLVVDDSDLDRQMILTLLRARKPALDFVELCDGAAVLDYLKRCGRDANPTTLPCLILLDLHMPMANGSDVLRVVKSDPTLRHIPVVIFSSSSREADRNLCEQLGTDAYVIKSGNLHEFRTTVREISDRWLETPPASASRTGAAPAKLASTV